MRRFKYKSPSLLFSREKYLINFFLASMPSTYERIIDNLNMRDILTLESVICVLWTKKTEFTDLRVIKEESEYFAAQRGFGGG